MAKIIRGSQMHLLDLLDHPDYLGKVNGILASEGVTVDAKDVKRPQGRSSPKEWYLPDFCRDLCEGQLKHELLHDWWVPRPWKPPQWDLISTCRVNGRPGLLLVEAKAHESELDRQGKRLSDAASLGSKSNHEHICTRIEEACKALNKSVDGVFDLRATTHYQLANRVAHLWKLASCGVPAVLLYLGFTGDTYFGDYLRNGDHWQRVMGGYMSGVVPQAFPSSIVQIAGSGSALMLIKSMSVQSPSPD